MSELSHLLPRSEALLGPLLFCESEPFSERLEETFLRPVGGYLKTSGKSLYSRMIQFAFEIADGNKTPSEQKKALLQKAGWLVDAIRTAIHISDDIQDDCESRKGQPPLHKRVGTPVALNAGPWLSMLPLVEMSRWGLPEQQELKIFRLCVNAMSRSQVGGVLDVGAPIAELPQDRVYDTTMACLELKNGTVMALAASIGGVLANADEETANLLKQFGMSFGIAVQMFEDIASLGPEETEIKGYGEWRGRRPNWVWACVAAASTTAEYERFKDAVKFLPDPSYLEHWLESHALRVRAKAMAIEYLDNVFDPLEERLGESRVEWIREAASALRGG